jgi:aspartate/tyrosine/aromatic aminotransferase
MICADWSCSAMEAWLMVKSWFQIGGVQALGGTGGIRLCADFTKKFLGCDTVYVSKPTWGKDFIELLL